MSRLILGAKIFDLKGAKIIDLKGAKIFDQKGANIFDQKGANIFDQKFPTLSPSSEPRVMGRFVDFLRFKRYTRKAGFIPNLRFVDLTHTLVGSVGNSI